MSDDDIVHNAVDSIDEDDKEENGEYNEHNPITQDKGLWRDLVAFWFLGLSNNYGYVVMLSAAHDIIEAFSRQNYDSPTFGEQGFDHGSFYVGRNCSIMSTGVLLLANTLPSMTIKIIAPFLPFYMFFRMFIATILSALGLIAVANAKFEWHAIAGIVMTSLSTGLGESSLMTYSPNFNKNVIATWASGTGAAGIFGAFTYAFLLNLGLTAKASLHLMLIVPGMEAVAFYILLRHPRNRTVSSSLDETTSLLSQRRNAPVTPDADPTFREKIEYLPKLLKYILPLFTVYLCEYFINQGLYELIFFQDIWLDRDGQYRWLQVDYQIGVFVSRSTVNLFTVKNIWLMSMLQMVNVFYFTTEAIYMITPNIWVIFVIVFWEGLLGGSCYVNTFYRIVREVPEHFRKFAMGMVGIGESFGIVTAGLLAIPAHNTICTLPMPTHR